VDPSGQSDSHSLRRSILLRSSERHDPCHLNIAKVGIDVMGRPGSLSGELVFHESKTRYAAFSNASPLSESAAIDELVVVECGLKKTVRVLPRLTQQ
jgi:hypothetical protein